MTRIVGGQTENPTPRDAVLPARETALDWLSTMLRIRRFEERAGEMYARAKIGGFLHLGIGEEAAIVGAVRALEDRDWLIATYRSHGHALARGTSPDAVMAELFGRTTGCSGGKGGSMHLFDLRRRFMGGWGIVGGNIPVGAGFAFACQYRGVDEVTLCVFGDGATNQGTFAETLNLASLWGLPIVFLIANNRFGMGTALERHSAVVDLVRKGSGFGVEGIRCDGMDVLDTFRATSEAVETVRGQRRPMIVEALTYRFRGHSMADPERYRTREEVERWRGRDPIQGLADRMRQDGLLDDSTFERLDADARAEVERAVEYADGSPEPAPRALWENAYALGGQVDGRSGDGKQEDGL